MDVAEVLMQLVKPELLLLAPVLCTIRIYYEKK